jgi:hypothetical protein
MTPRQPRLLSYSEVETALTCWARWDFSYGGRLAGSTLKSKSIAPVLSDGRAWGAAVAAWHAHSGELLAGFYAQEALRASLAADEATMRAAGLPVSAESLLEADTRLSARLGHYMATATPFPNLTKLEGEIVVPLPSRAGPRSSPRYRFQCFLDGFTNDTGQEWLVEFKLRNQLTPPALLVKQRQPRWYAWAWAKQNGRLPAGVIVEERLNEAPRAARLVKARRKADGINGLVPSHDKAQVTTPEAYIELCLEFGEDPHDDVVDALRARIWQQRFPLAFRPAEIDAVGRELVDAAKLIRNLDAGEFRPIRNATKMNCSGCRFRDICAEPGDELYVESLFTRTVPKRLREPKSKEAVHA